MKFKNSMTLSQLEEYVVNNQSIANEFNIKVDEKSVSNLLMETVYDGYLDCDSQLFMRDREELNNEIKELEANPNLEDYEKKDLVTRKILLKLFDENNIDDVIITRG